MTHPVRPALIGRYVPRQGRITVPGVRCDLFWVEGRLMLAGPLTRARASPRPSSAGCQMWLCEWQPMQILRVLLMIGALMATPLTHGQDSGPRGAEESVRQVLGEFVTAWNDRNMQGFGSLFSPSADFVVVTGKMPQGRDEIQSYHTGLITVGPYKDSRLAWTVTGVRFLRGDVAVAHVDTRITFAIDGRKDDRTSVALVVLTREQGHWLIQSLQNTLSGGLAVSPTGR